MKNTKNNEVLMEVLAHIQAAARIMSGLTDDFQDELLKQSSADDELDFVELRNIAEDVESDLLRMVPKMRLLIYSGAPKGTVYKKTKPALPQDAALIADLARRIREGKVQIDL